LHSIAKYFPCVRVCVSSRCVYCVRCVKVENALKSQPNDAVNTPVGGYCLCTLFTPSPFTNTRHESCYTFYRRAESRRPSRPRHCRKGVQAVPKAVYCSAFRDGHVHTHAICNGTSVSGFFLSVTVAIWVETTEPTALVIGTESLYLTFVLKGLFSPKQGCSP